MDVLDRTTRMDAVTAKSTPSAVGSSATPVADPNSPSFADSFARPGRHASNGQADAPSRSNSDSLAGETNSSAPATQSLSDVTADASPTVDASDPKSVARLENATVPFGPDIEMAEGVKSEEAVEETLHVLLAGLIAVTAVSPPMATLLDSSESPALAPPASLLAALQPSIEQIPATTRLEPPPSLTPLPAMPIGLQQGISSHSSVIAVSAVTPLAGVAHLRAVSASPSVVPSVSSDALQQESQPILEAVPVPPSANGITPDSTVTTAPLTAPPAVTRETTSLPNDSAPISRSMEVAPKADQTTSIASGPERPSAELPPLNLTARTPQSPTTQSDAASRDLLSFATAIMPGPSTTRFPLVNETNVNQPVATNRVENPSPNDVPSIDTGSGPSPVTFTVDFTARMVNAAPASQPASGIRSPNLVEQLQPVLQQAITQDRELTMTLRPPELGAVRIDVQHRDGQLTARLHTETVAAHQLLTEQLPQLRDVLTQLGVASEQVQVVRSETSANSSSAGFLTDRQSDARQSDGRQESPPQRSPEPQRIDEPERDDDARPAILTRTALNLRI